MITSVKKDDFELIFKFCEDNLLGVKIVCQLKTYGVDRDFLNVWYCSDEKGVNAVIAKFEDSVTLLLKCSDNLSEIKTFINMLGYTSLCTGEFAASALGYNVSETKNAYIYHGNDSSENLNDLTEEYYKSAYELISTNIPDSFENSKNAYLSFLSDFTFRKRRGAARIKGTLIEGKVASCALTSAETENAAIISGVACDSHLRKKGLGKSTVLALADELRSEKKDVYVIALNKSAEGFYEHIGFRFKEKISFIERK